MVATIDKWKHLTMEDIRKLEEENRKELEERIKSKEIAMAYRIFIELKSRFTAGVKCNMGLDELFVFIPFLS